MRIGFKTDPQVQAHSRDDKPTAVRKGTAEHRRRVRRRAARLHELPESRRGCQDIVGVIIEYDQERTAQAETEGESNAKLPV